MLASCLECPDISCIFCLVSTPITFSPSIWCVDSCNLQWKIKFVTRNIHSETSLMHQELDGEPFQEILCYKKHSIKEHNKRSLGVKMIHGTFFCSNQEHTHSIPRLGTWCTRFRRNMCGYQEATTVILNTLQKDRRSILMAVYSGMFIGGSRLSTRVRRSKSLPSNFLMKGWFCNNRKGNSAPLTKMNGGNSNIKLSIRKLLSQNLKDWPRVLKQTSSLLDPSVCCQAI